MMEHLHTPFLLKSDVIDRCLPSRVETIEHTMHFAKFSLPVGFEAWFNFLESRTNDNIMWMKSGFQEK